MRIKADPQTWQKRGQIGAKAMKVFSWQRSMERLVECLIQRRLLENLH